MRFALIALAFFGLSAGAAAAQDWRAIEISGAVRVLAPGEAARAVGAQDVLPAGAVVTTGRDSRAVFSNGRARATLSANSRLTLAPSEPGFTRFVQDLGAVLFQVDRQRDPHFEVRTSLVAAVVKGTTFTVSVEPDQHRVFVAEGAVEVSPAAGGDGELVSDGGMAEISRDAPGRVHRPETPQQQGATAAAPLNYAALSGGLLRNRTIESAHGPADDARPFELALADRVGGVDGASPGDQGDSGDGNDVGDESGMGDDDAGTGGDDSGTGSDDAGTGSDDAGTGDDDAGTGDDDAGTGDDDDDGNNGHGNDDDGDDDSNPGGGGGGPGHRDGDDDDNDDGDD